MPRRAVSVAGAVSARRPMRRGRCLRGMAGHLVPQAGTQKTEELRRSARIRRTVVSAAPAKKAPLKKAAVKAKKPKATKGKASDSNQEPSTAPAQNGENKEA